MKNYQLSASTRPCLQAGNTLIELLIATIIVGLVLTAVAMTMMYSIQREATNRYREYSTQLALEASEQLNLERAALGWQAFQTKFSPAGATTNWCFLYSHILSDSILVNEKCEADPSTFYMDQFNITFKTDIEVAQDAGNPSKLVADVVVTSNVGGPDEFAYTIRLFFTEREY